MPLEDESNILQRLPLTNSWNIWKIDLGGKGLIKLLSRTKIPVKRLLLLKCNYDTIQWLTYDQ